MSQGPDKACARPCSREGCSFIALVGGLCRWHAEESRETLVTSLLHTYWDPIGCGVPGDEYASYAKPVIDLVDRAPTRDEAIAWVAAYLVSARMTGMMLTGGSVERDAVAAVTVVRTLRPDPERVKGICEALEAARASDVREGWSAPIEAIESLLGGKKG